MFNASIFFITLNNDNKGSPQLGLPPHTHACTVAHIVKSRTLHWNNFVTRGNFLIIGRLFEHAWENCRIVLRDDTHSRHHHQLKFLDWSACVDYKLTRLMQSKTVACNRWVGGVSSQPREPRFEFCAAASTLVQFTQSCDRVPAIHKLVGIVIRRQDRQPLTLL